MQTCGKGISSQLESSHEGHAGGRKGIQTTEEKATRQGGQPETGERKTKIGLSPGGG